MTTRASAPLPLPLIIAEPPARYAVRPPLVVDSSMLCALLFDEAERDEGARRLVDRQLFAPNLLDHEIVNVALKKLRAGLPVRAVALALSDYSAYTIELRATKPAEQYALAERYGLSAYDAAYLWLAAELKAPLATFDRKLGEAAQRHLGALE